MVINSVLPHDLFLLLLLLHRAEVVVPLQAETLLLLQSFEGFVPPNFVGGGQLEATSGDHLAIFFDLVHDVGQSVELSDVLGRQHDTFFGVNDLGWFVALDKHSVELP